MKLLFWGFLYVNLLIKFSCELSLNDRPVIGILTEELSENSLSDASSFIMSFDVKFIESSGAQVVPIFIYQPKSYYQKILKKVNGVLFPGGGDILNSTGYGRAGKIIFDIAVQMNKGGDFFPIWGTCLGFELLAYAAADKFWMKSCSADDWVTNIMFSDGYKNSRMFKNLPIDLKKDMQEENLTLHLHHWCITPENFTVSGLGKYFKILSTNKDLKNETFVSIIEGVKYPFYGVSFHPERVLYDWTPRNISTPHSSKAIRAALYFGNFFVSEARKNSHRFPTQKEELSALIYNYNPHIDGPELSAQMYTFD